MSIFEKIYILMTFQVPFEPCALQMFKFNKTILAQKLREENSALILVLN